MPFPRKLLNDYENVILDLHPHWWFFGSSALSTLGAVFVAMVVKAQLSGIPERLLGWVLFVAIIGSAAWLIVDLVRWRTTYFVVTSHRVIYREGVLARQGVEIPLERVNNVNFSQGIFERMLGVGDLLIESGGTDGQQTFTDIRQPEKVQNYIHSAIRERAGGRHEGTPMVSGPSVADELERLEALRDRGTLTDEEFDEQKRRLLG